MPHKRDSAASAPRAKPADAEGWTALSTALDALPFYVLLVDAEHRIVGANATAEQHLGFKRGEMIGAYCPEAVHGLCAPFPGCPLEEAVVQGCYVERELYDEKIARWFRSAVAPTALRTADGRAVYLHMAQDITDQKRVAAALERAGERSRASAALLHELQRCSTEVSALEALVDGLLAISWIGLESRAAAFIVERDMLRMAVARNLPETLASTCERVARGHCLCGQAAETLRPIVRDCVAVDHLTRYEGIADHGHVVLPVVSGGACLAVLNFYVAPGKPLTEEDLAFLGSITDACGGTLQRLRVQQELARTDRVATAGVLATLLGHEIRTPLNALAIHLRMARRALAAAPGDDDRAAQELATAEGELTRIVSKLNEQVIAAAADPGEAPRAAAVDAVAVEALAHVHAAAASRLIALRHENETAPGTAVADATRCRRALVNLLLHAITTARGPGTVTLATRERGELLELEARRDGLQLDGTPEAPLDEIRGLARLANDAWEELGIAVCTQLAREMKGTLARVSDTDGGTSYRMTIPATRS